MFAHIRTRMYFLCFSMKNMVHLLEKSKIDEKFQTFIFILQKNIYILIILLILI